MDKELRIAALKELTDKEYFEKAKKRASNRSQKVLDKYKDANLLEERLKASNEAYDITHKGMTQEQKEASAEAEYRKKRKEVGLE